MITPEPGPADRTSSPSGRAADAPAAAEAGDVVETVAATGSAAATGGRSPAEAASRRSSRGARPSCPWCRHRLDGLLPVHADAWPLELRCPECGRITPVRRTFDPRPFAPRWSVEHARGPLSQIVRSLFLPVALLRPALVHRRLGELDPPRRRPLVLAALGMVVTAAIVATLANAALLRSTGGSPSAHVQALMLPWSSVPVVDRGPMPPTARTFLAPYWTIVLARVAPILTVHLGMAVLIAALPSVRSAARAGATGGGLALGRGWVLGLGIPLLAWFVGAAWIAAVRQPLPFAGAAVASGLERIADLLPLVSVPWLWWWWAATLGTIRGLPRPGLHALAAALVAVPAAIAASPWLQAAVGL